MRRTNLLLTFLASILALVVPADADVFYQFTYTPANGPVRAFSFTLSSPAFITPGTPALSPFNISDGSNSVSITQAASGISTGFILGSTPIAAGDGCFAFGSANADIAQYHGCGSALHSSVVSEGAFVAIVPGGLPSTTSRIRKVTAATGVITTVAGTGTPGYSGDGGPATSGRLNYPVGVAVDGAGNIYIADFYNHRTRKVTASTGVISTFAGTGAPGFSGDGGPATGAQLQNPTGVAAPPAAPGVVAVD